ncbi:SDR family NAD(P)-dependent oxidoreductase [Rhodovulum kholense]|uniref:NAD(P)-dependent dehydrogenase (Short-subunit alcohol dehydrogenase family) n=1 Tax=Rhodovulum kholense TaxID=453584 RepID=A0A8E2VMG1_9RHOB|nr:SDR family oxidoreductase [Rhodovulum kholense]PTW51820.1 NAD(P)-dependent dehydrogenase (short-subunit alcohol dehydrogenase family) [Rhodovulum kholense]
MKSTASIAIITGGSRGMGRDAALHLAQRGVSSIITYHTRQDEADKVVSDIQQAGAQAAALQLDVGKASSFPNFADSVRTTLTQMGADRFDYLVNNAGISSTATLADGTEAELDTQFAVHFKGPFLLTQALLPLMSDGGRIVNISSGLTRFAYPGRAIYGPMKAAVETLTRYMALELGPRGIAVNVVAPGAIATDFSGGVTRDNPEVKKALASRTALGRVGGPEDVGPVISSLLTDDFGWVNGQRIEVTGGMNL